LDLKDILSERGKEYGPFEHQARISQLLKHVVFEADAQKTQLSLPNMSHSQKEAMGMILHKVSRIANGNCNHMDSWRDIAGYATLIVNELNEGRPVAPPAPSNHYLRKD